MTLFEKTAHKLKTNAFCEQNFYECESSTSDFKDLKRFFTRILTIGTICFGFTF